jgi:uncharacterized protein YggE
VSDHVKVTGSARRTLAPDGVRWSAEALERDEDPRAAFERCATRLNELSSQLSAIGEVSTSAVTVQPEWGGDGAPHPTRVQAVAGVRVRAAVDRAGEVAQAAMAAGADRLSGPQFVYDGVLAAREELLDEAMADARRRAARLAAAAERRLGRVISVEAESDDRHVGEMAHFVSGGGPEVIPREQTVTATVTVVFALED